MPRFLAVLTMLICPAISLAGTGLSGYYPVRGEVPGWTAVDTLMEYVGDDLFLMIDGGAEVYREYGFVRAGMQEFGDKAGHSVTIELYEMKDPGAAYGMFSFKAGRDGKEIAMGNGGRQTDYYLNFWKGPYLATLTGSDTSSVTKAALTVLGGAVTKKITATGQAPGLSGALRLVIDGHRPVVTCIRGPIALNNFYRFGGADLFGSTEGYVIDYDIFKAFVFGYDAEPTGRVRFAAVTKSFAGDSNYTFDKKWVGAGTDQFLMVDRRGRNLLCTRTGRYIVVTVGRTSAEVEKAAEGILVPLRQN